MQYSYYSYLKHCCITRYYKSFLCKRQGQTFFSHDKGINHTGLQIQHSCGKFAHRCAVSGSFL
ncbi:hypothetical protein HMPREF9554_01505 [Treponema phagedenis F0421]|nr:hypothetical protein HMPREF9554_01505 [Treponema phagedenis F0421]